MDELELGQSEPTGSSPVAWRSLVTNGEFLRKLSIPQLHWVPSWGLYQARLLLHHLAGGHKPQHSHGP